MLKEHINIECNLRVVQTSVWFDEAAAGNFDLAISAIVSSLMDPSDYFTAWYGKNGPQNYAGWTNEQFHTLAKQIERELDDTKRKAMVRQAEDILEQDPPLIPISYEQIYDAWYNKVRGQNPSTYLRDLRRVPLGQRLAGAGLREAPGPRARRRRGRSALARCGSISLRRALFALGTLVGVSLIIFVVLRILPGDPLVAILGVEGYARMTPADRARIMHDLGLSDPLPVQYVHWLRDIATGKLGKSFFRGDTVADLILHRGPDPRGDRHPRPRRLVARRAAGRHRERDHAQRLGRRRSPARSPSCSSPSRASGSACSSCSRCCSGSATRRRSSSCTSGRTPGRTSRS